MTQTGGTCFPRSLILQDRTSDKQIQSRLVACSVFDPHSCVTPGSNLDLRVGVLPPRAYNVRIRMTTHLADFDDCEGIFNGENFSNELATFFLSLSLAAF
jgi:hypothetical protein